MTLFSLNNKIINDLLRGSLVKPSQNCPCGRRLVHMAA